MWAEKKRLLFLIFVFALSQSLHPISIVAVEVPKVHIVYMGDEKHGDPKLTKQTHHRLLSDVLGSNEAAQKSMIYSYKHGFSGFAATLTKFQVQQIADRPGVVQVVPSHMRKLQTTRSWDFLGLELNRARPGLLTAGKMGKGVIIGVIDSGVWPESKSFSVEGMDPTPSRWKGICQEGERFNSSNCNRKLIGARWFAKGALAEMESSSSTLGDIMSPRDSEGHGTHTASTAAGNFVANVSNHGLAKGLVRGGAPRAHLAIYKACWEVVGCNDADILKAFDEAIHDGVDIISMSIGGAIPFTPMNSVEFGSFHAVIRGITVVAAAGNAGPVAYTAANVAPWYITVGASTTDRRFMTAITLGNNQTIWGASVDTGLEHRGFHEIVFYDSLLIEQKNASLPIYPFNQGSLNKTLATGKIVLCFDNQVEAALINPVLGMLTASAEVKRAGGVGLIYAQSRHDLTKECTDFSCVKVDYETGTEIFAYIKSARFPVAKLGVPRDVIRKMASPRVAHFSSRGPNTVYPQVLKPDVVAPGVDILAAVRPLNKEESDSAYMLYSGTSMAAPHVAGIVALIKSVHPDWSPGAIRSALVTTATITATDGDRIHDGGPMNKKADYFEAGAGLVNPNKAMDPGLVYDTTMDDYTRFLMSSKDYGHDLNLPSITIPNLRKKLTVTRTVTNVGPEVSEYEAIATAPYGTEMEVEPHVLRFNSSAQVLSFKVTFSQVPGTPQAQGGYKFGSLVWTDGEHTVTSPVAVRVLKSVTFPDI